jgi:hypothetical protein
MADSEETFGGFDAPTPDGKPAPSEPTLSAAPDASAFSFLNAGNTAPVPSAADTTPAAPPPPESSASSSAFSFLNLAGASPTLDAPAIGAAAAAASSCCSFAGLEITSTSSSMPTPVLAGGSGGLSFAGMCIASDAGTAVPLPASGGSCSFAGLSIAPSVPSAPMTIDGLAAAARLAAAAMPSQPAAQPSALSSLAAGLGFVVADVAVGSGASVVGSVAVAAPPAMPAVPMTAVLPAMAAPAAMAAAPALLEIAALGPTSTLPSAEAPSAAGPKKKTSKARKPGWASAALEAPAAAPITAQPAAPAAVMPPTQPAAPAMGVAVGVHSAVMGIHSGAAAVPSSGAQHGAAGGASVFGGMTVRRPPPAAYPPSASVAPELKSFASAATVSSSRPLPLPDYFKTPPLAEADTAPAGGGGGDGVTAPAAGGGGGGGGGGGSTAPAPAAAAAAVPVAAPLPAAAAAAAAAATASASPAPTAARASLPPSSPAVGGRAVLGASPAGGSLLSGLTLRTPASRNVATPSTPSAAATTTPAATAAAAATPAANTSAGSTLESQPPARPADGSMVVAVDTPRPSEVSSIGATNEIQPVPTATPNRDGFSTAAPASAVASADEPSQMPCGKSAAVAPDSGAVGLPDTAAAPTAAASEAASASSLDASTALDASAVAALETLRNAAPSVLSERTEAAAVVVELEASVAGMEAAQLEATANDEFEVAEALEEPLRTARAELGAAHARLASATAALHEYRLELLAASGAALEELQGTALQLVRSRDEQLAQVAAMREAAREASAAASEWCQGEAERLALDTAHLREDEAELASETEALEGQIREAAAPEDEARASWLVKHTAAQAKVEELRAMLAAALVEEAECARQVARHDEKLTAVRASFEKPLAKLGLRRDALLTKLGALEHAGAELAGQRRERVASWHAARGEVAAKSAELRALRERCVAALRMASDDPPHDL